MNGLHEDVGFAKLYGLLAPNYAAVIESYEKAKEVVKKSAVC